MCHSLPLSARGKPPGNGREPGALPLPPGPGYQCLRIRVAFVPPPPAGSLGSPATTSFPGGSAEHSPGDGAAAAKLPRGPLGRRREPGSAGLGGRGQLGAAAAAPSAGRPRTRARPPPSPFPGPPPPPEEEPAIVARAGARLTLASASFCLGLRSPTLPLIVAQARGAAVAAADGAPTRSPPPPPESSPSLLPGPRVAAKPRLLKNPKGRSRERCAGRGSIRGGSPPPS